MEVRENPSYANSPDDKRHEALMFSGNYYTEETFRWWTTHPYRRHTLRHLTRYLRDSGGASTGSYRVVEPACGCGVNLTNLAMEFFHFEYYGLDLSLQGSMVGRNLGFGDYLVGDAEDVPFPNETFDLCLCIAAIHHFHRNPERFLAEMCRIIKKGALIYILEPDVNLKFSLWDSVKARWVKARIRHLNNDTEFADYGTIPSAPTEGPFERELALGLLLSMGMELLEEGFTEYLTEWARHFAKGFDLAAKFDANLKPAFQERQWKTGGTKYYAILRKKS